VPTTAPEADLHAWLNASRANVPLAEAQRRLQRALSELERAPIATLHACAGASSTAALSAGTALRPRTGGRQNCARLLDDLTRWLAHALATTKQRPACARPHEPATRAKLLQAAMQPGVVVVGGEVATAIFESNADAVCASSRPLVLQAESRPCARLGELADWLECGALCRRGQAWTSRTTRTGATRSTSATKPALADPVAVFARKPARCCGTDPITVPPVREVCCRCSKRGARRDWQRANSSPSMT
jgi:hypothetical protein